MSADIIVYALVAAGLIFWLRSILGTRHGDEKNRPNPYMAPPEKPSEKTMENIMEELDHNASSEDKITDLFENPLRGISIENKSAESGLLEIAKADKSFDLNFFMEGAQEAFAMIVECFGEGDRESLKDLLAEPVYEAFDAAISEREKNKETMETEIHAIKKAEVIEARTDKKNAYITIRFTADETSVIKDSDDQIITGHPDKVTEMRDVWVFTRALKARDPRWLVYETRGDFDGDNETIPNSDE